MNIQPDIGLQMHAVVASFPCYLAHLCGVDKLTQVISNNYALQGKL